jgi:ABC-type Na+ efflux pump permease subunit
MQWCSDVKHPQGPSGLDGNQPIYDANPFQILNVGFFLYGATAQPAISSYLLYIFVANLMVYTSYYMAMKLVHREKMTFQPIVYSVLALAFWLPGLYFFVESPVVRLCRILEVLLKQCTMESTACMQY